MLNKIRRDKNKKVEKAVDIKPTEESKPVEAQDDMQFIDEANHPDTKEQILDMAFCGWYSTIALVSYSNEREAMKAAFEAGVYWANSED